MNFIVEIIIDSIIRAITYAIAVSVTTSIRNSIRKSVSKKVIDKLEKFLGSDGEIDEEKISSLIQVNVVPAGSGIYQASIDEEVFDMLHMKVLTPKNTDQMFKNIAKHITVLKMKAKMRKDDEAYEIANALLEGFKQ